MDAQRQEFCEGVAKLQETNTPGFLGLFAILQLSNGKTEPPKGYSRGDFKRTIKSLREFQHTAPEHGRPAERAIALIRQNWLHREVDL